MNKSYIFLILLIVFSCGRVRQEGGSKIITVSIPPFRYFVEAIGGDDFTVNVMVPPGASPHDYEPVPEQIGRLGRSAAYISDGYLGFELAWLDRFYEANNKMIKLNLGDKIDVISSGEHTGHLREGKDPHYWISPACAKVIALSVKELLCRISPENEKRYNAGYLALMNKINETDLKARELFGSDINKSFMIFHPTLGYLARDYGLEQVAVEWEGKEPSAARIKELIDMAREKNLRYIFVQKGFDDKNARAIAADTGAELVTIDPLMENWPESVMSIVNALHSSFINSAKSEK
jgi:zinc transport system substrate-binding protein